ncbi:MULTISPECIES: tRNA1(Val) (adenine(37)-N6)-methyltransferase [unclassified Veillonella]|uniref:tRNA1(Val) (adenine(37)-N6)-methyltransferase n=1 Tax=unclassified Veillonella TaxID=2630086 RepID=UPI000F8F795F|nr:MULTISPECIES: methyltransferase [unclassified Veillonella]
MKSNITVTELLLSEFQLFQDEKEFKFSIDAILLAHFGEAKSNKYYLELGTGTGVIPHVLYHRGARHIVGVDCNPRVIELAQKSVIHNDIAESVSMVELDYMINAGKVYYGQFDGIYMNPPYFEPNSGLLSQEESVALALHEQQHSMKDRLLQAQRYLKFGGTLWMIYTTPRLESLLHAIEQTQFRVKRMRFVHGKQDKVSKLVLLELKYGGKLGMIVEPPLYIYEVDGSYSEEVQAYYE